MHVPHGPQRQRRSPGTITTKSGKTLKVHRSLADRAKSRKLASAAEKATYLSTLPKDHIRRLLYRLHPKRVIRYWFSREGGIMALKIIGVAIITGFFLIIGLFAYFRKDLPKIKDIAGTDLGGSITYYDRSGQTVLWQDYNTSKRIPVTDKEMSPFIKQATVAIEDKDYYKHGAFDVRGIARAASRDVAGGGKAVQGGSTITQQLVKLNQEWTDNRTVTRKVKELILAVELEREYSKDEILTGYLNVAPYGGLEYGVESAARDYFQTSAKDLSLAQATTLAAIPQSPQAYSPYGSKRFNSAITADTFDPAALLGRQHYILDQMVKQGYITKTQASDAKKVDVLAQVKPLANKFQNIKAPYFVLTAKQELENRYGTKTVQRGGWKVITTLNMDLQNKAEQLIADNIPNITRSLADQEAAVGEDVQTGQIVTLVGGTDFTKAGYGQNNYASGILIPPGSSFKPYDYTTMLNNNNNVGAGSVLYDSRDSLPGYEGTCPFRPTTTRACPPGTTPHLYDYDSRFPDAITLRYALGGSRNIPAVKAMLQSVPNDTSKGRTDSINKVITTATAMMANSYTQAKHRNSYNCYADEELTITQQCYAASAIGDGAYLHLDDHVNGLATLARMGNAIPRTYILKVTDASNKTLYQFTQPKPNQVIKADAAYIINDMASDPRASYLPGSCTDVTCTPLKNGGYKFHRYNGWHFAVKTGTTNDNYDGLMTSWSTKYAFVAWVGNHTRHVTINRSMEFLTAPITENWMQYAHTNEKPVNWTQPSTVKLAPAYVVRNHINGGDIQPSPTNDLYPGYYIGGTNVKTGSSETTDKVSGKVATSCTPAGAKQTVTNGNANFWNADVFHGGKPNIASAGSGPTASAPAPQDDVHNCNDAPPTVSIFAPATCDSSCTITATVTQGTHALNDPARPDFPGTLTIAFNGQAIHSENVSDSPQTISFTYTPTASGSGSLTATVTDSVLYQGTDTTNLNVTVAPAPVAAKVKFQSVLKNNFVWNGGTGPYAVYLTDKPNVFLCQNATASECKPPVQQPLGTKVTIRDSTGDTDDGIVKNN